MDNQTEGNASKSVPFTDLRVKLVITSAIKCNKDVIPDLTHDLQVIKLSEIRKPFNSTGFSLSKLCFNLFSCHFEAKREILFSINTMH